MRRAARNKTVTGVLCESVKFLASYSYSLYLLYTAVLIVGWQER